MNGLAASLLAAVAGAVLYGVSSILQARAAAGGTAVTDLARSPAYLAGLGCDGIAWILSLLALRHLPLFVVQSVLAASLAVTAVLGMLVLKVRLSRVGVVSVGALVAALAVLAGSSGHQTAARTDATTRAVIVVGAACLAVFAVLLRRRGALVLAVVAGLAFSGAAIAARAVTAHGDLLREPAAWAVLAYGATGAWAYAAALEHGEVTAVTATQWSIEVVVPTGVGLTALGDTVRAGWWAPFALALAVVLAATAALARSTP